MSRDADAYHEQAAEHSKIRRLGILKGDRDQFRWEPPRLPRRHQQLRRPRHMPPGSPHEFELPFEPVLCGASRDNFVTTVGELPDGVMAHMVARVWARPGCPVDRPRTTYPLGSAKRVNGARASLDFTGAFQSSACWTILDIYPWRVSMGGTRVAKLRNDTWNRAADSALAIQARAPCTVCPYGELVAAYRASNPMLP